ncbi:sulfate reduction electron transfer complex DsrMKJOP subunit DsrJ [Dehalobacterium formicoaceticum]|nr:sulfate reduction electron transfer complex DsrMKJOP subunit DsrJ [Dehalobacterium formicoaceticum]
MYDKKIIIPLLVVVVLALTYPIFNMFGQSSAAPELDLNTPEIQALDEKKCIEDTEFMRSNHMQLLNEWRIESVRNGLDTYVATDGKEYEMSLQNTCLSCHSDKEKFCDSCHTYSDVNPNCWTCHIGGEL